MTLTKKENGNSLVIAVKGRLDTTTAPQLETELYRSLPGITDLTFDFAELKYISSAGLWLLLSVFKSLKGKGTVRVINVSETIREVFEVTGFAGLLSP